MYGTFRHDTDSICVVRSGFGDGNEKWNINGQPSYCILNTKSGTSEPILNNTDRLQDFSLDPSGEYVAYYNATEKNYFCYQISTKKSYNLTKGLKEKFIFNYNLNNSFSQELTPGIIGWRAKKDVILIQSIYDIWSFNVNNLRMPENITVSIGEKNKIIFYPANIERGGAIGENLLLSALDTKTKEYGFYDVTFKGKKRLNKLSMYPYSNGNHENAYSMMTYSNFKKAKHANVYLIKWQQCNSAPNYYISFNLKTYKPISAVQPQKKYNWLYSELHNYHDSLGNQYQGILYKPEDFNPDKKYPLIFITITTCKVIY